MNTVFVVYKAITKHGTPIEPRNCELKYNSSISHIEDIEEMERMIEEETHCYHVKILNWRRFE